MLSGESKFELSQLEKPPPLAIVPVLWKLAVAWETDVVAQKAAAARKHINLQDFVRDFMMGSPGKRRSVACRSDTWIETAGVFRGKGTLAENFFGLIPLSRSGINRPSKGG